MPSPRSIIPAANRRGWMIPAALLCHMVLLVWGAADHSPSVDEVGHMAAGVSHWQFGRFDLYRVNPPLVRLVAAIPVVLSQPETDWGDYSDFPSARPEFSCGRTFIEKNGARSLWLFTIARWACIPFSLLGAWMCHLWGRDLYGAAAGRLACLLWCFSPTILGQAQMITPDTGATRRDWSSCSGGVGASLRAQTSHLRSERPSRRVSSTIVATHRIFEHQRK